MSGRRRRLWSTGAIGVAASLALATFSSPPAEALASHPAHSRPAAEVSTASAPAAKTSLAALDAIILRPLTVLRGPGEAGAIIAHRGNSSAAPENTMPAFVSSIESGAEYCEIDIRLSKDGVPVVIHDRSVDRTTDGAGAVSEMTISELRALDAGSWLSETFAGTPIPTLDEVLALAASSGTRVLIEYKGTWSKAGVKTTVDMIEAVGLTSTVVAQSFSQKTVARIADAAPELTVGWLTEDLDASTVATATAIEADAVNPRTATARGVARAHRAGLGVFVWTQDAETDWRALTAMGVDGIITNRPDALLEWVLDREKSAAGLF